MKNTPLHCYYIYLHREDFVETSSFFSSRRRECIGKERELCIFHPIDRNEQQTSEFIHSIQDEEVLVAQGQDNTL